MHLLRCDICWLADMVYFARRPVKTGAIWIVSRHGWLDPAADRSALPKKSRRLCGAVQVSFTALRMEGCTPVVSSTMKNMCSA